MVTYLGIVRRERMKRIGDKELDKMKTQLASCRRELNFELAKIDMADFSYEWTELLRGQIESLEISINYIELKDI